MSSLCSASILYICKSIIPCVQSSQKLKACPILRLSCMSIIRHAEDVKPNYIKIVDNLQSHSWTFHHNSMLMSLKHRLCKCPGFECSVSYYLLWRYTTHSLCGLLNSVHGNGLLIPSEAIILCQEKHAVALLHLKFHEKYMQLIEYHIHVACLGFPICIWILRWIGIILSQHGNSSCDVTVTRIEQSSSISSLC